MIVLDASAMADALLDAGARGEWARGQLLSGAVVHVPHLLDFEVASVVRGHVRTGQVTLAGGRRALEDLRDAPFTRYPARHLLERIWQLRNVVSAYDAAYVALAELLGAPLVTTDERLGRSRGHRAVVRTPGT